jgi:hypothetical protein
MQMEKRRGSSLIFFLSFFFVSFRAFFCLLRFFEHGFLADDDNNTVFT